MYLALFKLSRILLWATLAALCLALLMPDIVPLWLPLGMAGAWAALVVYGISHVRQTRRPDWRCPLCGWAPFAIAVWKCKVCGQVWDSFATGGTCPRCGHHHEETACLRCRRISPNWQWRAADQG
jgi:hypothetical protein